MRAGACHCGALRYVIDGPVRDVLICHCDACVEATGAPWAASAAARTDLAVADDTALVWERATDSEHDASRGSCGSCGTLILWDAPGRATVSFAVDTLADASDLEVAGRIWVGEAASDDAVPIYPEGLPDSVVIPWRS
jgi:hypothetical protein